MKSRELTVDEFLVPAMPSIAELKVKGSRFIASIERISCKDSAENRLAEIRKVHYNATHNCFAYRIEKSEFRFSDDGEPSGTAGKPIYQVLEGQGLNQALCVVTRYYGGTKLGTGGLIRAYSDAANQAFKGLKLKTLMRTRQLNLFFTYDFENLLRNLLSDFNGKILESDYAEKVRMQVAIPESKATYFFEQVIERSNSLVKISQV